MRNILKTLLSLICKGILVFYKKYPTIETASIKNILVVQTGGIGDVLRIFPAIKSIYDNFPMASVSVLVFPRAKEAFQLFPEKDGIREIIDYDPEGIHKGLFKRISLILSLRRKNYDLIYVPARGKGTDGTLIMAFLAGASHRIGFEGDGVGFLNTVCLDFEESTPIAAQNLSLLKVAGLEVKREEICLDIPEKDVAFARRLIGEFPSALLISLHIGAVWNARYRSWPIENHISLLKILLSELNARIVIIGGEDEMDERIARAVNNDAVIDTVGKVTIPQMAAIIKLSDVFIGNDSGPLHIAEATETPYIGIFGPTSPQQVLSYPTGPTRIILRGKFPCSSPCYTHRGAFRPACEDIRCRNLDSVSAEEVLDATKQLVTTLQKNRSILCE